MKLKYWHWIVWPIILIIFLVTPFLIVKKSNNNPEPIKPLNSQQVQRTSQNGLEFKDYDFGENHTGLIVKMNEKDQLFMWGSNEFGQVGNGSISLNPNEGVAHPKAIDLKESTIKQIALGGNTSGAITSDAQQDYLYMWGNDDFGQVGNSQSDNVNQYNSVASPTKIALTEKTIKQLAVAQNNTGVITSDGTKDYLYLWGFNGWAQLGDNVTNTSYAPLKVTLPETKIKLLDVSHGHTAVVTTDAAGKDHLYMWGENSFGEIGSGSTNYIISQKTAINLPETKIQQIALGKDHSSVVTEDSSGQQHLYMWGSNVQGQLGDGTRISYRVPAQANLPLANSKIKQIATGDFTSGLVLTDTNNQDHLYLSGANDYGQMGNNDISFRPQNVNRFLEVPTEQRVLELLVLGYNNSSYISQDVQGNQNFFVWGLNYFGQLGVNTQEPVVREPVQAFRSDEAFNLDKLTYLSFDIWQTSVVLNIELSFLDFNWITQDNINKANIKMDFSQNYSMTLNWDDPTTDGTLPGTVTITGLSPGSVYANWTLEVYHVPLIGNQKLTSIVPSFFTMP